MQSRLVLEVLGNVADVGVFTVLGNDKLNKFVFEDNEYYSKNILLLVVGFCFMGNISRLASERCKNPDLFKENAATNYFQGVCCTLAITAISLIELRESYLNTWVELDNDNVAAMLFLSSLIGALALKLYEFKNTASNCNENKQYERILETTLYHPKTQPMYMRSLLKVGCDVVKLASAVGAVQQGFISSNPNMLLKETCAYSTAAFSALSAVGACVMHKPIKPILLNEHESDASDNERVSHLGVNDLLAV